MATNQTSTQPAENVGKGLLLASLAIPVGIILWVILWRAGYMASLVSFVIAFLAVWLYKKGAGTTSRKSAPFLFALIILGILLSFLGGMVSDALDFLTQGDGSSDALGVLLAPEFWSFFGENIFTNSALWESYSTDILIALGFGALGSFTILKDLFISKPAQNANITPKKV